MSTEVSRPGERSSSVLCVLEDAQRLAYHPELSKLDSPGVEVSFEDSPDRAFELIDRKHPDLVVVGMTVGMMEGLEFLAALMGRARGYRGRVLMLPDKGDPFLPQLHTRDAETGKSMTESVDFGAVASLFSALARPSTPREELVDCGAPAAQEDARAQAPVSLPDPPPPAPTNVAATLVGAPMPPVAPLAAPSRSRRWLPLALAGAVVVAALAVAVAVASRSSSSASASRVEPSARPAEPAPEVRASQTHAPAPTAEPAAASDTEAHARSPVDLRMHQTLPLFFAKRAAEFTVVDGRELDSMVAHIASSMKERPKARLEVGGHTSKEGAGGFNFELGKRRAAAAKSYLVKRGVPEASVVLKSYEAALPVGPREAELDGSRRVTVRLLD